MTRMSNPIYFTTKTQRHEGFQAALRSQIPAFGSAPSA